MGDIIGIRMKKKEAITKVCKFIFNDDYRFIVLDGKGFYNWLDDEKYIKRAYKVKFGIELNLDNPQSFNEKIQWLKIHDRKPLYTQLVDKYNVKKIVAQIIGEKHIIPTLGVWNHPNEIPFDSLPDQFVMKATHDSGGLVICKNKNSLDYDAAKRKLEKSLKRNYYKTRREWPYKNVIPRIIVEKYMEDICDNGKGLIDYKFFCFDGEPRFIYVSQGLDNHSTARISFYDLDGNEMSFHRSDYLPLHNFVFPDTFSDMIQIARKLANNIPCPFVRIDLYSINGNIYFSEITFSPCSGMIPFEPKTADIELGKLLDI